MSDPGGPVSAGEASTDESDKDAVIRALRSDLDSCRDTAGLGGAEMTDRGVAGMVWDAVFPLSASHGEDCPTYYDGCNCSGAVLARRLERVEAELARRDATLQEYVLRFGGVDNGRCKECGGFRYYAAGKPEPCPNEACLSRRAAVDRQAQATEEVEGE